MVGKNGMEIGCLLEEEFQKVNLYVLRETAIVICFKTNENLQRRGFSSERKLRNSGEQNLLKIMNI